MGSGVSNMDGNATLDDIMLGKWRSAVDEARQGGIRGTRYYYVEQSVLLYIDHVVHREEAAFEILNKAMHDIAGVMGFDGEWGDA